MEFKGMVGNFTREALRAAASQKEEIELDAPSTQNV